MTSPTPLPRSYRVPVRALAVGLLVLGGLAAGLVWTAKYFYARELAARAQLSSKASPVRAGNPAGRRVLLLGDSRAADWPALPVDRYFTINGGVTGETTAQILARTEALLSAEHPSVAVLQAGINDLKVIGVRLSAARQIEEECTSNIVEIVKLCRRHKVPVVLTLILPAGKVSLARRLVWSGKIETALRETNLSLSRRYADAEGVVVLDLEKILAQGDADPAGYSQYRDTLHLKPSAYLKLEPALLGSLERLPLKSNIPADQ